MLWHSLEACGTTIAQVGQARNAVKVTVGGCIAHFAEMAGHARHDVYVHAEQAPCFVRHCGPDPQSRLALWMQRHEPIVP